MRKPSEPLIWFGFVVLSVFLWSPFFQVVTGGTLTRPIIWSLSGTLGLFIARMNMKKKHFWNFSIAADYLIFLLLFPAMVPIAIFDFVVPPAISFLSNPRKSFRKLKIWWHDRFGRTSNPIEQSLVNRQKDIKDSIRKLKLLLRDLEADREIYMEQEGRDYSALLDVIDQEISKINGQIVALEKISKDIDSALVRCRTEFDSNAKPTPKLLNKANYEQREASALIREARDDCSATDLAIEEVSSVIQREIKTEEF